jgi:hypothetical protein
LGVLGASAGFVPNRIVFFVLSPCLFFAVPVLRRAGSSPCRFFAVPVLRRAGSSPCRFFAVPVLRRAGVGESLGVVLLSLGGRGIAAVVWISTRSLGAVRYL